MNTEISFERLMDRFIQAVNKYNDLNSIAYDYGSGTLLYPSEIHALNAIQSGENPNITDIAVRLGITKSAASQVVQKLTAKGLAEKYKASGNAKEVLIRLSAQGLEAFAGFLRMREAIFHELLATFDLISAEQRAFLGQFFDAVIAHFDTIIKERRR